MHNLGNGITTEPRYFITILYFIMYIQLQNHTTEFEGMNIF